MLVLAGLITWLALQIGDEGPRYRYRPPDRSDGSLTDPTRAGPDGESAPKRRSLYQPPPHADDPTAIDAGQPQGNPLLDLLMPDDSPQPEHEPADLPAFDGAIHLDRTISRFGRGIEETSIWSVPDAELAAVTSFYVEAARDKAFELLNRHATPDGVGDWMSFRRDGELLIINCRKVDTSVSVVVQLRYDIGPAPQR